MKFWSFLVAVFFPFLYSSGQVTTDPEQPIHTQPVTLIYDATQGTAGLAGYAGDVYAHIGVITDQSTSTSDWEYVKTTWGVNTADTKMTRIATNTYELELTPNIRDYFGVPANEEIQQIAMVFRSGVKVNGNYLEGKGAGGTDIFVDAYKEGANVTLVTPTAAVIANVDEIIPVEITSPNEATLQLLINDIEIASTTGTTLTHSLQLDTAGDYWLKAIAQADGDEDRDSVFVTILDVDIVETLPESVVDGINYIDDQTVTFVLYAPGKEHVFLIGDFNDWLPESNYRMKKDGDRFWVTLDNLTPQQEYIFQYLVDGEIRIGDPYAEKISDPWDDKYITNEVYPNLIDYPEGKTTGRATVFQTSQANYTWQYTDYEIPKKKDLIIYELLFRDFTEEGTVNAALQKLDYLEKLGVNAIELMPFNEFEGNISWGYNPNYYFAPDKAYGTKNDYKAFIDECHRRGIIVIQDMVFNHSYGSSPMVKLYWDETNNRPTADNPWYNVTSPNTAFSWGYDFNHESEATQNFIDSVNNYWVTEYKIDGFRFDFTKGFTNTPGDGSAYDASRIAILKRMADEIWATNPDALVILEHFAPNTEEQELVAHGMLVWGNMNYKFNEAAMGYHDSDKSNLVWTSYREREMSTPGVVTYMESHDEERQMYKNIMHGNSLGSYNIKDLNTALQRSSMATVFFFAIPGPKMIWQFGELGYDISIDENGRTGEKPVHWEYYEAEARKSLFNRYKAMAHLRNQHPVFTQGEETLDVGGAVKTIQLSVDTMHVTLVGNFDVSSQTATVNFAQTGTWHEYFSGDKFNVASTTMQIELNPGAYMLFADKPFSDFSELTPVTIEELKNDVALYPNPATDKFFIQTQEPVKRVEIYDLTGRKVLESIGNKIIDINHLNNGLFIVMITTSKSVYSKKLLKK